MRCAALLALGLALPTLAAARQDMEPKFDGKTACLLYTSDAADE